MPGTVLGARDAAETSRQNPFTNDIYIVLGRHRKEM